MAQEYIERSDGMSKVRFFVLLRGLPAPRFTRNSHGILAPSENIYINDF